MRLHQQLTSRNIALVVPCYNEVETLPKLLSEINATDLRNSLIVIVDDSTDGISLKTVLEMNEKIFQRELRVTGIANGGKQGRGKAVIQGLNHALNYYSIDVFVELDADGSHQISNVIQVLNHLIEKKADFVVGSRYLNGSQISGWSIQRKIFSRALNILIPKIFNLEITDITNGLRAYNSSAVNYLINGKFVTGNFVFLTESFLFLKRGNFVFKEFPIQFVNRKLGNSTVGWKEVLSSLVGLIAIWKSKRR